MLYARVIGHATSTIKHESMVGATLLLCEDVDATGKGTGSCFVAGDWLGANVGSLVLVTTDGEAAERHHKDPRSPLRNLVIAIVDQVGAGAAHAVAEVAQ